MQTEPRNISVAHTQAIAMAAAVLAMLLLSGGLPHWGIDQWAAAPGYPAR
jgi:outer membrane murein-binding lipoprotein Lpp